MKCKKCCLSFGEWNSKYCWFVLGVALLDIISTVIVFTYFFYSFKNNKNEVSPISIMSYLFFLNLGESLMIIPNLILKKNISSKKVELSEEKDDDNNDNISVKFIFQRKTSMFSLKEKVFFYSVGLLKLLNDAFYISYQFYIEEDYSFIKVLTFSFYFELIFLFFISKIMYNITYYRHQYVSIIVITFFELIKFIIQYSGNGFTHDAISFVGKNHGVKINWTDDVETVFDELLHGKGVIFNIGSNKKYKFKRGGQ